MLFNSIRHALYWAHPLRWPEACIRLTRRWRGLRWCRSVATTQRASGNLYRAHATELAEAKQRVQAAPEKLGGPGNLELLYNLCEELEARRVIETGVAYGWSSLAILCSITKRNGHLWSTDLPYAYLHAEQVVGIAVPERFRGAWTLLRGADAAQVPNALAAAGMIDLAHYDSDKTLTGMLRTGRMLFEALRPGGVLIVDDAGDHLGLRELAATLGVKPVVISHADKYQGILRKPG
jgi:predicted O-methyltransferase YrrM